MSVYLSSINYELGELAQNYVEAEGYKAVIDSAKMPEIPTLWGWGEFYSTENIFSLATASIKKTLSSAEVSPDTVEAVILCSSNFEGSFPEQNKQLGELLNSLELHQAQVLGTSLTGCVCALTGMNLAFQLVKSKAYTNVLLVVLENVHSGMPRFSDYGVFSDAAASCLISADTQSGFHILDYTQRHNPLEMINRSKLDYQSDSQQSLFKALFSAQQLAVTDIDKLIANNTFIPLKTTKEKAYGFKQKQLFLDNISRTGHCFASDTLIGLADLQAQGNIQAGSYYCLYADADGHEAAVLLQSC